MADGGSKLTERAKGLETQDHFRQGVEQFNSQQFFAAHESWEAIWLTAPEPDKTFLQGITQISAGFHHESKGNHAGARTLLQRGLEKLMQFPASYRGVNVDRLRAEVGEWLEVFARGEAGRTRANPKIEWVAIDDERRE